MEKLALYADDLMLFLNDLGPSLRAALNIIYEFSELSGLKVNWNKSQALPIDPQANLHADPPLSP